MMIAMSLYADLLEEVLRSHAGDASVAEPAMILEQLRAQRRRLGAPGPTPFDITGEVAEQVCYDLMLLRLCAAIGVEHAPARFAQPEVERRRLEEDLRRRGIDLGAPAGPRHARSPGPGLGGTRNRWSPHEVRGPGTRPNSNGSPGRPG